MGATGEIAETFTKDLLRDPLLRASPDTRHVVVAAASSTSEPRARAFLAQTGCPAAARAYGSYAALAAEPDVQIVYVATPHSHHYQNAMLCLRAGKHVLCEKALAANAAQARALVAEARSRGLFFMEAVWTRFFPLARDLRALVARGHIGEVRRVVADFGLGWDAEELGPKHRLMNSDLAGGALLDLCIYPITWVFQFLYHIAPADRRSAPEVLASMTRNAGTGVDETTTVVLTFPGSGAQGIATASIGLPSGGGDRAAAAGAGAFAPIRIQGDRGEVQVYGGGTMSAPRPTKYRVVMYQGSSSSNGGSGGSTKEETGEAGEGEVEMVPPAGGHGLFWEADECARCIRDGRLQSEVLGWDESIAVMDVMDKARLLNGLRYPDKVETLEYPVEGM